MKRKAFTLVELLVVIGIIAVLVSILMPALSKVRQSAQSLTCSTNIRTMVQATLAYAADNEGSFPAAGFGSEVHGSPEAYRAAMEFITDGTVDYRYGAIYKYVDNTPVLPPAQMQPRPGIKRMMTCPADPLNPTNDFAGRIVARNFSYSYNADINIAPGNVPTGPTIRLTQIYNPARKIIIFEEKGPNDGLCDWFSNDPPTDRHYKGGNMGFADGHVERMNDRDIYGNFTTTYQYCRLTGDKP